METGIRAWRKEYFNGRMRDVSRSPLSAIEHSLRKWEGLRKSVLKAYKLKAVPNEHTYLVNTETGKRTAMCIDDTSCSCCHHTDTYETPYDCQVCPITVATGQSCVKVGWLAWENTGDPLPMIAQLKKARKVYIKHMKSA